jgi:uncharacterized protein
VILCDTGPLVAAFNKADNDHVRRTAFLRENWSRLVIPSLAVTEICHLLADPERRGRPALAAEFCAAIADDELRIIEVTPYDYRRMSELLKTYSSLRLQAVDACLVALAERLDLREIAALDRRDFQVVAPRHLGKGEPTGSGLSRPDNSLGHRAIRCSGGPSRPYPMRRPRHHGSAGLQARDPAGLRWPRMPYETSRRRNRRPKGQIR